MHVDRRQERAVRVVLVRHRRPVQRQQRVAGELLDVTTLVLLDHAAQCRDYRIDDLKQLLWIEPVRQ